MYHVSIMCERPECTQPPHGWRTSLWVGKDGVRGVEAGVEPGDGSSRMVGSCCCCSTPPPTTGSLLPGEGVIHLDQAGGGGRREQLCSRKYV